ncbi:hypothetical protein [Flavobacterium acetivorans]|uniref:hypothetical protein n=1 Tax=Flavobacterium acetivorans TaxID=2893883 RepID=UPI001E5B1944|nr:hypothetical protein [Flavobacterium sp. F-29]UFH35092.1 hypothetical protein LNP19_13525 [Flavobacterium sp. F-29]
MLSAVVVAFAIFGAASTDSIAKDGALAPDVKGWYHLSPTEPCIASTMCNEQGTEVCTVNDEPGQQLFRKTANTACEITLYRPID